VSRLQRLGQAVSERAAELRALHSLVSLPLDHCSRTWLPSSLTLRLRVVSTAFHVLDQWLSGRSDKRVQRPEFGRTLRDSWPRPGSARHAARSEILTTQQSSSRPNAWPHKRGELLRSNADKNRSCRCLRARRSAVRRSRLRRRAGALTSWRNAAPSFAHGRGSQPTQHDVCRAALDGRRAFYERFAPCRVMP